MWGERLFLSCPFGHTRKERNTIANALSATRKSIPAAISFLYLYEGHYDVALCLGIVLVGARGHFFFGVSWQSPHSQGFAALMSPPVTFDFTPFPVPAQHPKPPSARGPTAGKKESPAAATAARLFERSVISWRFHANIELLWYRSITANIVEFLLALRRVSSNIFCIAEYLLYRVATDLRQDYIFR